jgi:hypothetical protein
LLTKKDARPWAPFLPQQNTGLCDAIARGR